MSERLYVFTAAELHKLLEETIGMFGEYVNEHGHDGDRAVASAVGEIIGGLDAEDELFRFGECKTTHVREGAGA